MTIPEFRDRLSKLHPVLKGLLFTLLACVVFFIERWLFKNMDSLRFEAHTAYRIYDLDTIQGVIELVIVDPIEEEFLYRGPVWLMALVIAYALKKYQNVWLKITAYLPCFLLLFSLNYFWAFNHAYYPYTIFAFGLVWGTCVIITRKLHYAIILHAGSNAFATIGLTVINYFSN